MGPVDPGKPPNVFKRIICDPDTKSAEARGTGVLYTAVSQATSLGDINGMNSAIYFIGEDHSHKKSSSNKLQNQHRHASCQCPQKIRMGQTSPKSQIFLQNQNLTHLQQITEWAS